MTDTPTPADHHSLDAQPPVAADEAVAVEVPPAGTASGDFDEADIDHEAIDPDHEPTELPDDAPS